MALLCKTMKPEYAGFLMELTPAFENKRCHASELALGSALRARNGLYQAWELRSWLQNSLKVTKDAVTVEASAQSTV